MEEKIKEIIKTRIKNARLEANMSQEEVALSIRNKKERQFISNIETGKRMPSLEVLYKLAHLYGRNINELIPEMTDLFPTKQLKKDRYSSLAMKALREAKKEITKNNG